MSFFIDDCDFFDDLDNDFIENQTFLYNIQKKHLIKTPNKDQEKLFLSLSWINENWKYLFSVEYVEQKSPKWLEDRQSSFNGSEIWKFIGKENSKEREDAILQKCNMLPPDEENDAMRHGNKWEPLVSPFYCDFFEKTCFRFGSIKHRKYPFLAASIDWITIEEKIIEMKAPFSRNILFGRTKKDFGELECIIGEMMIDSKIHIVDMITNLTPEQAGLLTRLKKYWHQCQLQMEILNLDKLELLQFGVKPNPFCKGRPLLTLTPVKRDFNWLNEHLDEFNKSWDKIIYLRERSPNWKNLKPVSLKKEDNQPFFLKLEKKHSQYF
jgi:putative phage-type endonuclease